VKDLVAGSKWETIDQSTKNTWTGCILTITKTYYLKEFNTMAIDFEAEYPAGRSGNKIWSTGGNFFFDKCIKILNKIEELQCSIKKIRCSL
jgi:phenylacetate-coenzyme A ligase PaaK-like adenylate-forming protein